MALILDGRVVRDQSVAKLKEKISTSGAKLTLVIIQVGNKLESNKYIAQKIKLGEKIGATVKHVKFADTISTPELVEAIYKYNQDPVVDGLIVQLPLPNHLDKDQIINAIVPEKDVDGLTTINAKKLIQNDQSGLIPATALGVVSLLNFYQVEIKDKKVTIIGRSNLVGKPLAILLKNMGAQVSVGHRQTADLKGLALGADILIVAAGSPKLVTKDFVHSGQVVVDVGINIDDSRLVGDVDFEAVEPVVGAISPVPGGVGPMTVMSLFENLLKAAIMK